MGGKSWKGLRFVLGSALIATMVVVVVYGARHIIPQTIQSTLKFVNVVSHHVSDWKGVKVKRIELDIISSEKTAANSDPFQSAAARSRASLSSYYGQSFWLLDLGRVRDQLLDEGWARSVYVRRSFPESLKVQIVPRTPVFIVRGGSQWAVTDEEGNSILVVKQIPGSWTQLPTIFGLEESYSLGRSPKEMNRQLSQEREILKDLAGLLRTLQLKVGIEPDSVRVDRNAGNSEAIFKLHFASNEFIESAFQISFRAHAWENRLESLQFVLSDLKSKQTSPAKIMGQFDGRWFVETARKI